MQLYPTNRDEGGGRKRMGGRKGREGKERKEGKGRGCRKKEEGDLRYR
jgi:hypothetical protein